MWMWRSRHPYNAVHAVVLDRQVDVGRFEFAVNQVCQEAFLGALEVDAVRFRYRYHVPQGVAVTVQSRERLSRELLAEILSEDVNRPFSDEPHHPLRWTIVNFDTQDGQLLVLSYDHVAADAFAVQAILSAVLTRCMDSPPVTDDRPIRAPWKRAQRHSFKNTIRLPIALVRQIRTYLQLRSAHRIHEKKTDVDRVDTVVADDHVVVPPTMRPRLARHRLGINDLILSAVVAALASTTPKRMTAKRRRGIALSTVASVRTSSSETAVSFDARLDAHTVFVPRPDIDLVELVKLIGKQTRRQRTLRIAAWSDALAQSFAVRRIWPLFRLTNSAASYRKVFPVCAGVSTFRVDESWYGSAAPSLNRILRACPCGPALPVVFSPTIHGQTIETVLTYRVSCLDQTQATALLDRTIVNLRSLIARLAGDEQ